MFWATLYVLFLMLLGTGVMLWVTERPLGIIECAGLSLGLGLGCNGLLLFWISLIGYEPKLQTAFVLSLIVIAALCVRRRRGSIIKLSRQSTNRSAIESILIIVLVSSIAVAATVVVVHALGHPNYEWDAYMIWGLKAKVLTYEPIRNATYFHNSQFARLHLNYPLMTPFLMAGLNSFFGAPQETIAKLIFPLSFCCLGCFVYSGLRQRLSLTQSLMLTAIYLSMPKLLRWGGSGLADVPLAAFYSAVVLYLIRWNESGEVRDLILASLFMSFCVFTKNEGLAILLVTAVGITIVAAIKQHRRRLVHVVLYCGSVFCISVPWLLFRRSLPRLDENYPAYLSIDRVMQNWDRSGYIMAELSKHVTDATAWNGLWLLLAIAAILAYRGFSRPPIIFLWTILLVHLIAYLSIFLVGPIESPKFVGENLGRLLLHISPVAIILIGWHWSLLQSQEISTDS